MKSTRTKVKKGFIPQAQNTYMDRVTLSANQEGLFLQ